MKRRALSSAFTLIELALSIGVLVMLVILIGHLMSGASLAINQSGKRMDSDSQVRIVFDRMANDFGAIIRRQNVDYIFAKQNGNDTMYFFSEAAKYFDTSISDSAKSSLALVGYRVNSSFQLERLSRGLTWDGQVGPSPAPGSMVFLTYPSPGATPFPASTIAGNWAAAVGTGPAYSNGTGADYHVIGDQVYRLEVSFLKSNGTISTSVTSYNGLQDVAAIIVAVGMLDTTSRVIVAPGGQITSPVGIPMVTALPDAVDGVTPLQKWKTLPYLTTSGIPPAAASQLRIYERTFFFSQ